MANIKDLIKSIEAADSSFDEKLAAINQMEETLVAMRQQEEQAVQDNVDLIVEAIKVMERKVENQLEIAKSIVPEKGDKGDKGDRGLDGANGQDGKDGRDGINGRDGQDGQDGVSVTDAKIDFDGSLIITLSTGQEINVGEVVAPELQEKIKLVTSGGAGTVLPSQAGNANKYLKTDGTGLSWAAGDGTGTVTSVGGTGTVSGISLSGTVTTSGNLTLGGALDLSSPPAIGSTAASTGAFTTLSASSTVSGTGFSTYLASPPAIGGTTPAAGTFTSLTAQTEVLNGTGQNLIRQSNTWTTTWSPGGVTAATTVATNDPLGTTTAYQLTESTDAVSTNHAIGQGINTPIFAGTTYTWSIYVKAANRSWAYISNFDNTRRGAWFDLSTGTIGTVESGVTAAISSQGNGWYRCSITTVVPSVSTLYPYITTSTGNNIDSYVGTGVVALYVWRAQLQFGSVATTYVPTTTAIVWNVPNLSFISSATSGIGLQSDGSLYVQPAGTGALQAQATTSTATGGNARGANAVDWQTTRATAAQVASGQYAVIVGGQNNVVGQFAGAIVGGRNNNAGVNNYGFIGAGNNNTLNNGANANSFSSIVGGQTNSALGWYNFIGGGFTNSATATAAVTTQSGTMNATTAVTLSGSNANIKVGQYITGTSIATDTYVSAISGTSLTLSQAASGSSTSTLSFFTPHGVVVGGGNNQATGSYSFIGGGGDAGTAANRNSIAADWGVIVGGQGNSIGSAGNYATIGGGLSNVANQTYSTVVGGRSNSAFSDGSTALGGYQNAANALMSTVMGRYATSRAIAGNIGFSACNAPIATSLGVSQSSLVILGRQTTDATATVLASDSSAAGSTNQVNLPNNSAYTFRGEVVSGVTGGGNSKSWVIEGLIKRGANAAATTLVGSTVTSMYADVGAATWTIALSADTTNGGLAVTFTGQASTTIRTVCQIRTTEMTF